MEHVRSHASDLKVTAMEIANEGLSAIAGGAPNGKDFHGNLGPKATYLMVKKAMEDHFATTTTVDKLLDAIAEVQKATNVKHHGSPFKTNVHLR